MQKKFQVIKFSGFFVFVLFVSAACSAKVPTPQTSPYQTPLTVGSQKILVQIAKTPAELGKGLSDRDKLTDRQGMLFDFHGAGETRPGFWMKGMTFNLDFIWINGGQVVGIAANVPAPKNPHEVLPIYYPPAIVDMVLEVNAGWANSHKIKTGDKVSFNQPAD